MGRITKSFSFKKGLLKSQLEVVQKTSGEEQYYGRICNVEFDTFDAFTPKEIIRLGQWLTHKGLEILIDYDKNGNKRDEL